MSWFGTNLNDSFSSFKGQIVSLTKDVLADNEDEQVAAQAEASLITVSTDYVKQIESLQNAKAELESRLIATELESRRKVTAFEGKILAMEGEYKNYKEKAEEWNWQAQQNMQNEGSRNPELLARSESTNQQDAVVEKLQSELNHLYHKLEEADNDKRRLLLDMQELDSQHQQALEILCIKKIQLECDLATGNEKLANSDAKILELQYLVEHKSPVADGCQVSEDGAVPSLSNLMFQNKELIAGMESLKAKKRASSVPSIDSEDTNVNQLQIKLNKASNLIDQLTDEKMAAEQETERVKKSLDEGVQKLSLQLNDEIIEKKSFEEMSQKKEEYNKKTISRLNDKIEEAELKILKYEAVMEEQFRENEDLRNKYHEEMKRCNTLSEKMTHDNSFSNVSNVDNQFSVDFLQKLMKNCNLTNFEELPSAIDEKDSEIARLRCERDKLQEDLDTTLQDLKDSQDVIEDMESLKVDLEGECEELRDQLEELQYGKREEPEGSLSRALTTIEEETDAAEEQTQVPLESVKRERGDELTPKKDRTSPLKMEIFSLNEKCQKLREEMTTLKAENTQLKLLEDRNNTIEIGPITTEDCSEGVISTTGHPNDDLPDRVITDMNLLRAQIIFKDDQIDDLRNTIFEIGSFFGVKDYNLRETYCAAKREVIKFNTIISEHDQTIQTLSSKFKNIDQELNDVKLQYEDTLQQKDLLEKSFNDAAEEKVQLSRKLCSMDESIQRSVTRKAELEQAIATLERLLQDERNKNVEHSTQEYLTVGPLKRENVQLTEARHELMVKLNSLEKNNDSLNERITELTVEKEQLIENYENSLTTRNEECFQKNSSIAEMKNEISMLKDSMSEKNLSRDQEIINIENLKAADDELRKEYDSLKANNEELKSKICQQELELLTKMEQLTKEKDELMKRSNCEKEVLLVENAQLTEAIRLKEKESAILFAEQNRLTEQLTQSKQDAFQHQQLLSDNFDGKIVHVHKCLEEKTKELKFAHESLSKNQSDLDKWEEAMKTVKIQNEQLVTANLSFNSQYETVSKELLACQEKEIYWNTEFSRLKQHLMTVEESYTKEAVEAEQREAALKQTVAKLHEKMASHSNLYSSKNQKHADTVETLQESMKNAVLGRDEALQKLQVCEEDSLENKESLRSLNQVLLDFQKSYNKDVREASEKDRRELEKERDKGFELQQQANDLQRKIESLEDSSSSSQQLYYEIQTKEATIVGLQAQVTAMQQVLKKGQDQVQLLKSSSDVKVEKNLVRNLFVGYFASAANKQREVLHIIAQILEFSPDERVRTGLDVNPHSWLTSVANFLAPPPSNIRVTSRVDVLDHSSLSQAFIRFLEDESAVRPYAKLPAIEMAEEASQKALKKAQSKTNEHLSEATKSQKFSPLIDAPLSAVQPVVLQAVDRQETAERSSNMSEEKYLKNLLNDEKNSPEKS